MPDRRILRRKTTASRQGGPRVRDDAPSGTPPGGVSRVGDDQRWFLSSLLASPAQNTSRGRFALRAKGPLICLAQPNGLGIRVPQCTTGPTARPFVQSLNPKRIVRRSQCRAFRITPGTPTDALTLERAIVAWCDDPVVCCKWPGRWPSRFVLFGYPARWAGLGKPLGLRPGASPTIKWPGRWPSRFVLLGYPARWAGLGKPLGLRPGTSPTIS